MEVEEREEKPILHCQEGQSKLESLQTGQLTNTTVLNCTHGCPELSEREWWGANIVMGP